ncbi:hypothetical protein K438DRAFT_2047775 [Mycena galopus ATCC 62051]|nr:hypothetical protein K438DRAFT_2047775 [Mycena galopus ATCC 62051]
MTEMKLLDLPFRQMVCTLGRGVKRGSSFVSYSTERKHSLDELASEKRTDIKARAKLRQYCKRSVGGLDADLERDRGLARYPRRGKVSSQECYKYVRVRQEGQKERLRAREKQTGKPPREIKLDTTIGTLRDKSVGWVVQAIRDISDPAMITREEACKNQAVYDNCDVPLDVVVGYLNRSSGATNFAVGDDGGITRSGNAEASDAEEDDSVDAAPPVLGRGQRKKIPTSRYEGAA